MYYVYMLRCLDNSIYTGITNDLNKRMNSHFLKNGAKYTKSHLAFKVEAVWRCKEKNLACKLEYHIKSMKKYEKEDLILNNNLIYLKGKIDFRRYFRIDLNKVLDEKYVIGRL